MGKKKASEHVSGKKLNKKASNPFELRFTKEKFKVHGRKPSHPVGKPGVSRAKSIAKRKATLLEEYKRRNKQNAIVDRRIGEKDASMDEEERMLKRFAAERIKSSGTQGSKFNLGEDEDVLTHFGQSLAEVERFEDPRSDEEDDDDNKKLNSEFVDKMHFGGFMEKSDMEFASGKSNTRKEWIDSMISDSRKRKLERQKNLEESVELTMNLDAKWKDMLTSLSGSGFYTKKVKTLEDEEKKKDSYDMLMRELVFEPKKAKASDRLKTDEEIIKEEKDKLQKLEKERLARMEGAMELEDAEDEIKDEGGDSEEGGSEEEDSEEDGSENQDEEEDDYSDLEDAEDLKELVESTKTANKKQKLKPPSNISPLEAVQSEIPFVFDIPEEYEGFLAFFQGRFTPSENETIISRILKCNHPQLSPENKGKMERLFVFLIQYVHDAVSAFDPSCGSDSFEGNALKLVKVITPYIYDVAKFSPQANAKVVLNLILEKYEDFLKNPREYPALDTILFFKLTFLLFPSSDFRHPVVTPALSFMFHILSSSKVVSRASVTAGLLLCTMYLECALVSKRYAPEVANFLQGIIHMCVPKDKNKPINIIPPFKVIGPESTLLIHPDISPSSAPRSLRLSDTAETQLDSAFCVSALKVALDLSLEFIEVWREHSSIYEAFAPFLPLIQSLPRERYHGSLKSSLEELTKKIESGMSKAKKAIKQPPKKVEMLKLLEPNVVEDYDPFQKKRVGSKEKLESDKFLHKIKREMKGAKKDIRADSAFLAKQKAKEARLKDEERQRKTREIFSGLGNQEGDYRRIMNSKRKKK